MAKFCRKDSTSKMKLTYSICLSSFGKVLCSEHQKVLNSYLQYFRMVDGTIYMVLILVCKSKDSYLNAPPL
eukprot:c21009_g1_i1 orf=79-291(-)